MRTARVKRLAFQYREVLPRGMSAAEFAEILTSEGLIEVLERDSETGEITRYAETPALFKAPDKLLCIDRALTRLEWKKTWRGDR